MSGVKAKIPVKVDVIVDLAYIANSDDVDKVAYYLKSYMAKHSAKDWEGFDIVVDSEAENERVFVKFKGDGEYAYYPGSYRDPDEWDIPFDEDTFVSYVEDALKEMPFDVEMEGGKHFKADGKMKKGVYIFDADLPSDDDISDALAAEYPDYESAQVDAAVDSILEGKALRDVISGLKESAGDWVVSSEEVYPEDQKDTFERDFEAWKKAVYKANKAMLAGADDLQALLRSNPYNVDFNKVERPYAGSYESMFKTLINWGFNLNRFLDTIDPYDA